MHLFARLRRALEECDAFSIALDLQLGALLLPLLVPLLLLVFQAGDELACKVDGLLARFVPVLDVALVRDDADLVDTVNVDAICLFDDLIDPRMLVWNLVELVRHLEEHVAVAQETDQIVDERTGLAIAEAPLFEATGSQLCVLGFPHPWSD